MLHIFSIFNINMATQNSLVLVGFFKMHAGMTALTIQSNNIVLNEVKDN